VILNVSGISIPFVFEAGGFCSAKKRKKCLIFHRKLTPSFNHSVPDTKDAAWCAMGAFPDFHLPVRVPIPGPEIGYSYCWSESLIAIIQLEFTICHA
jgi:hypothetical protein